MSLDVTPQTQNVYNPGTIQVVTVGAAHAETTNPINGNGVILVSTTDCHVVISDAPVATANDLFLPKGQFLALACVGTNKVSVIQDSAGGKLWVTSLN